MKCQIKDSKITALTGLELLVVKELLLDPASAGRHQATDQTKGRMKWEKAVNKIVNGCWIRSQPTKRKYR